MLPGVGLFRTIPCPYFIAGLCGRPHCCFSHAKRDIKATQNNALSKLESNDSENDEEESDTDETITVSPKDTNTGLYSYSPSPSYSTTKPDIQGQPELQRKKSENIVVSPPVATFGRLISAAPQPETLVGKRKYTLGCTQEEYKRRRLESMSGSNSSEPTKSKLIHVSDSKQPKSDQRRPSVPAVEKILQLECDSRPSRNSEKESRTSSHHAKQSKEKSKTTDNDEHKSERKDRHESSRRESHNERKTKATKSSSSDSSHTRETTSRHKTGSSSSSSSHKPSHQKSHSHDHHSVSRGSKESKPVKTENSSSKPTTTTIAVFNSVNYDSDVEQLDALALSDEFLFPGDNSSDEDPTEIALECLEMFNSYKVDETKSVDNAEKTNSTEMKLPDPLGKKRVAHPGAEQNTAGTYTNSRPRLTPAEVLQQRYVIAQQNAEKLPKLPSKPLAPAPIILPTKDHQPVGAKRMRISHVANVSALLKPKVPGSTAASTSAPASIPKAETTTIVQTVQKGQTRIAHRFVPSTNRAKAPLIPAHSIRHCRVPIAVRQHIMEQIFQECVKIYPDEKDASERALVEEADLVAKCSSKAVYMCAGTNCIARLRREFSQGSGTTPISQPQSSSQSISHLSVLGGSSAARVSWSIQPRKSPEMLNPNIVFQRMKKYILPSSELESNGYPLPAPSAERGSGKAIAKPRRYAGSASISSKLVVDPFQRTCDRCKRNFRVKLNGLSVNEEDQCNYHPGKKFTRRMNGLSEGYYNCCNGDSSATGCAFATSHVSGNPSGELRGFVTAVKVSGDDATMGNESWDIVAIDCEMIYTTCGSELARATFIGAKSQVLYDELVKPIHPVVDYNTRYSGITEEMLQNTKTTLTDVQAVILTHLKPNAILIGHSLESDLIALKLIHHTVVDTSVMFPHKMGPPYKRALRNLSSDFLKKIIQESEGGHDSAEDAKTALELVLWKVNEDIKIKNTPAVITNR